MKKVISLLLVLVMCLSMCACEKANTDEVTTNKNTVEPTSSENTVQVEEISLNQKITVGEAAFTLTKFEWKDELLVGHKWRPGSGNVFARIKLSFHNEGRKEMKLKLSCRMNYDDGYEVKSFFGENGYNDKSYPIDMTLAAGRTYELIFAAAEVSEYAKTDLESPLWIEIEFEGQHYIYYIRK